MSSYVVYVWDDSRGTSSISMVCSTESQRMVELLIEMGMLHGWRIEVSEPGRDGKRTKYGKWKKR